MSEFVLGAGVSFIRSRLIVSVGEESTRSIDSLLAEDSIIAEIARFFRADGPKRLIFFYQPRQSNGEEEEEEGTLEGEPEPELFLADLDHDELTGKCVYFVRECHRDVDHDNVDADLSSGELTAPLFEAIDLLLSEVHSPYLKDGYEWGKISPDSKEGFLLVLQSLREHVQEAVSGIQGGTQLSSVSPEVLNDPRAGSYNKMAMDESVFIYIESVLDEWIRQVDTLLKDTDMESTGENDDAGPVTELSWWRKRMAKLSGVVEQLKGKEARFVLGLANAGKSRLLKRWKQLDGQLTDLLNEAKDNVKYLSSLDHFIEPLYAGTIPQIKDSLPGLFTNLKMMVSIARYYSTGERITRLLRKIANQIIAGCRRCILRKGRVMEQDARELVDNTRACVAICADFKEHCNQLRERLAALSKGSKQIDFDPKNVLPNIEKFVNRMNRVVDMINTSLQFSTLYEAEVEGMGDITSRFEGIMQDLKMKPYDFFDYTKETFDVDFAAFGKQIAELEYSLRVFIDVSFEDMQSTENALELLRMLEAILQRDSLKGDLSDKYALIFEHYGDELEEVQNQYDRQKLAPPMPRNAPPVAGNIMWARQLLTRVEEPMQRFLSNKAILAGKESRNIIKKYNKVALTLTEFETLWFMAWSKSIDSSRAGLNATLIVRNPDNPDELCVNFDPEVMQLLRETKALHRLGIELPDTAKMILLQENKFKVYYERMRHHLDEYNRLLNRIAPTMKQLMGPHLEEFERIFRPGMVSLTWLSMNIDAYLHKIHSTLHRLNELISSVLGVIDFRVERNLKVISRMLLVDLPSDVRFTLDQYVARQEQDVWAKTKTVLAIRNEVESALSEVVAVLKSFRTDNDEEIQMDAASVEAFKKHYSHLFYLSILNAVKRSFAAIKQRLGSRTAGGFLFVENPFFDVDVELTIPNVTMHPSLDEVQNAINESARLVLSSAKSVPILGDEDATYHSVIASDMQVVQSVLLLTGSVEGSKRQVLEYLDTYKRYEFLWTADKNAAYVEFMQTAPDMDAFEAELSKYQNLEQEIAAITPVHVVGCMSLRTQSLKYSLKAETAAWKSQYAQNLHGRAKKELDSMVRYFSETKAKLSMEVQNVDEVGEMVAHLTQLRSREADLDLQIVPMESMYYILAKYDVRIPKEETDTLTNIRPMWRSLMQLGQDKSARLTQLQSAFKKELVKTVKGFALECMQFCNEFDMHGPMVAGLGPAEALERLTKFQAMCQSVEAKVKEFHDREQLFGLPLTQYTELSRVRKELDTIGLLYSLYSRTEQTIARYSEFLWINVATSMDKMRESASEFQLELAALPRVLRDWAAYKELKQTLHDFQQVLPILAKISGPAMRTRHWNTIQNTTGKKLNLHADHLRLRHILDINPVAYRAEIEEVCTAAIREAELELKVRELAELWTDQVFTFANYKDRGPVTLDQKSLTDVMEKLEESLATLTAISNNRYSKPLEEEVVGWITKLSGVSEIVEHWSHVQAMWINVEAVFSLSDISTQLTSEARRFHKVDAAYMKLMGKASEYRNVIDTCFSDHQLRNLLPHLAGQLELCQKSLAGYLDQKRAVFPRFFFVSDRVLLEILSEGVGASAIEQHMSAMFDGLRFLTLEPDTSGGAESMAVTSLGSRRGTATERLALSEPVEYVESMEVLLGAVLAASRGALKDLFQEARASEANLVVSEIVRSLPMQICVLLLQVQWSRECHDALSRARAEKNIMLHCNKRQAALLGEMIELVASQLSQEERFAVETMVAVQVQQREVFDELVQKRAFMTTDFDWVRRVRYVYKPDFDDIVVNIADISSPYSWEYLGLRERLVCTAVTARCFVALSQAVGMCTGCSMIGPAGTGKTESVKDLGRGFGRFVASFTCTKQMDGGSVEKMFKGLAASGSWGCFDEFNRINVQVLSACAQHVQCVLGAVREGRGRFVYSDGQEMALDVKCGIFVTLNPDYEARQDVGTVSNLKTLFRCFSLMSSDPVTVIYVRLLSFGYDSALVLAKKFAALYALCEDQLSRQRHYDFGMRNMLVVLRALSLTKREEPTLSEHGVLMTTLRRINVPKLVQRDVPIFLSILNDLLPDSGTSHEEQHQNIMEDIIKKQVWEDLLDQHPPWIEKMLYFHQICSSCHGVMLTGPSGCGKTAIVNTLCRALSATGSKHAIQRMNPKAVTSDQMFGWTEPGSREWHDGVFASLWRSKATKQVVQNAWIVLDGPIDPIWIENLNSALDDSKILTLANGDRIPMSAGMRLVFENDSLRHAAPSVISRSGIVCLDETTLGWRSIVQTWLETRGDERAFLRSLFDRYLDRLINFVAVNCSPVLLMPPVSVPKTITALYESVCREIRPENLAGLMLEKVFLFCLSWGVGGCLEQSDRIKFSNYLRSLTDLLPTFAGEETIFDYYPEDKTADWELWRARVPPWEYPASYGEPLFHDLIVPTPDICRTEFLIKMLSASPKSSLIVTGPPGSCKSVSLRGWGAGLDAESAVWRCLTLSSETLSERLLEGLHGVVEKRQGRTFGPVGGKRCVLVIEDVNQPKLDAWGDQIVSELLRQLLVDGGYYSTIKPEFNVIVDVQYTCEMTQPSVSHRELPTRLKGRMMAFNVTMSSDATISSIFSRIISGRFKRYAAPREVADVGAHLGDLTVEVWQRIRSRFLPTPSKVHLKFQIHDISRIFQGMLRTPPPALPNPEAVVLLWKHEVQRVLLDKLTNSDSVEGAWEVCAQALREKIHVHLPHHVYEKGSVVYADFGEGGGGYRMMGLSEVAGFAEQAKARAGMDEIVLFEEAVRQVVRIVRVLGMLRGSMLLVGMGGSGRRSLSRLAAMLLESCVVEWTCADDKSRARSLEELRLAFRRAGVRGEHITLLIDNERRDPQTLDFVNQFLSMGEFPNLLSKDDIDVVMEEMRNAAAVADGGQASAGVGKQGTDAFARFLSRARDNVHVVLCFSPGEKLVHTLRGFQGIARGCTIDWFMPWQHEAARSVASALMGARKDFPSTVDTRALSGFIASVHVLTQDFIAQYALRSRRPVYVTPKTFLSLVDTYGDVCRRHLEETQERSRMMAQGLRKLMDARDGAAAMQIDLQKKDAVLVSAQDSAGELLKEITDSTMKAEKKKGEVSVVKNQLAEQASVIEQDRDECERDLAAAKPALLQAEAALHSINQKDLMTLKSMKNPPTIVRTILDTMLILLHKPLRPIEVVEGGGYRDSFNHATQVMNDPNFVSHLMNFPKEALTDEDVELVAPYLAHKDFQPEKARQSSAMAAGLCAWVRAITRYQEIARQVLPKFELLHRAEEQLALANKHLQRAIDELDKCQAELDVMQARFEVAMGEKQRLNDDAQRTRGKIGAANRLIAALQGENDRWVRQTRECNEELRRLPGDSVMAATFMEYMGPLAHEARGEIMREIAKLCTAQGITASPRLDVQRLFTTHAEVRSWVLEGLPTDEGSVQSATLAVHCRRYPLLIDPQEQGIGWIRKRGAGAGLVCADIHRTVAKLRKGEKTHIEDCLLTGREIVLENVGEDVDGLLDPLLAKSFTSNGKRLTVKLGGHDVEYTPSFRLVLSCRLPNPHFGPELSARTTIIDFTVTMEGLSSQLLSLVMEIDQADMQRQRVQTHVDVNTHKRAIEELNVVLLERLSGAEGNLLDDEQLMQVLSNTKSAAEEAARALEAANRTEQSAKEACEEYGPVATRGSLLFFAAEEMSVLAPLYQVSLPTLMSLFSAAVREAESFSLSRKGRIAAVIGSVTLALARYCRRIYFAQHRSVFGLIVALKVLMHEEKTITREHVKFLARGGTQLQPTSQPKKQKEWISDVAYLHLSSLADRIPKFSNVIETIVKKEAWRQWVEKERLEEEPCPDADLDAMQRLLLIRALREDRVVPASRVLVAKTLGDEIATHRGWDLEDIVASSTNTTPIICVSRPGVDASSAIVALARRRHKRFQLLSLGQGHERAIRRIVFKEAEVAGWVVLQNAHLCVDAVNNIDKVLAAAQDRPEGILVGFRLWITTEQTKELSLGLVSISLRAACEPPVGIRANMQALYSDIVDQDLLDSMDTGKEWCKLVYSLSYLYCVLRERAKYGSLGWSLPGGMDVSDWSTCIAFLNDYMLDRNSKDIKRSVWVGIRYMISEIYYGGRIIDEWDRRVLFVYTDRFFADEIPGSDLSKPIDWFTSFSKPDSVALADQLNVVNTIAREDRPEMYGLGSSAEHFYRLSESQLLLQDLCETELRSLGDAGAVKLNAEARADEVAAGLLSRIPHGWKADYLNSQLTKLGATNPLILFLRQELDHMIMLLQMTRSTLRDLRLGIGGAVALSDRTDEALESIADGRIPPRWSAVSWSATSLTMWAQGLQSRYEQLDRWLSSTRPKSYWLGGFFNPQGFVAALKQEATRKHVGWALDEVKINTEVYSKDSDVFKPDDGVVVSGLYLEGASWSTKEGKLANSTPKNLFNDFPKLVLTAVLRPTGTVTADQRPSDLRRGDGPYVCPCYANKSRGKQTFVMTVSIKTDEPTHKWVLRGVALVCVKDTGDR